MKRIMISLAAVAALLLSSCMSKGSSDSYTTSVEPTISTVQVSTTQDELKQRYPDAPILRIERGVAQVASLWRSEDGTAQDFHTFCLDMFVADDAALKSLYDSLERNFEILSGYFHKIDAGLKAPLQLEGAPVTPLDMLFGSYDVSAHLSDDLFANRIAFVTALNFPYYTLAEKEQNAASWSRLDWAYARMGDRFTSRVPSSLRQQLSKVLTENDTYIAEYNIMMGRIVTPEGNALFPEGMKLISHWGLRDELKSNYSDATLGLQKQRTIYEVMKRIIDQSIPEQVINNESYTWEPFANKIYEVATQTEASVTREPDTRYKFFLDNFHAAKALDPYYPQLPTQIDRAIDGEMEIPLDEVVTLFDGLLRSQEVRQVAQLISQRLGRSLEPFDIWYDGFKDRTSIDEAALTRITQAKYPNPAALKADLPTILQKMGWGAARAQQLAALIEVDASRGAGHAMGSAMRGDAARLRTRISNAGMDYKGYNIAVHEFGHNVEQTISMNDADYYMLNGVPNTGFTEALAFLFQHKDLKLLGMSTASADEMHYMALDNLWNCYEIMGVSLVDIKVWQWLYEHPEAAPAELRDAVLTISKEVWNTYFADVLGGTDEPLLAIYSHMLAYPLYLPNYAIGHLISFQIEKYMVGRNLSEEVERMFRIGRVTPNTWMKEALAAPISTQPTLEAAAEALKALQQ